MYEITVKDKNEFNTTINQYSSIGFEIETKNDNICLMRRGLGGTGIVLLMIFLAPIGWYYLIKRQRAIIRIESSSPNEYSPKKLTSSETKKVYCPDCGSVVDENGDFCSECGKNIRE